MRDAPGGARVVTRLPGAAATRVRLVVLPHAGGGAASYRAWRSRLPADVELVLVHLPGREARLSEPPFARMAPLLDHLAAALVPMTEEPYVLFGHSFGAVVAHALAQRLPLEGAAAPSRVVVSAHRPPGRPDPRGALHEWPRARLVEELARLGGTPREVFDHPELVDLLLPAFRADLEALATWTPPPAPPLSCGITAFSASRDPVADEADMRAWREFASEGGFRLRVFEGGHFYVHEQPDLFHSALARELELDD